jgi:hypothetical protein
MLVVKIFVQPDKDDLLDDNEYKEIMSDLFHLEGKVGKVATVFVQSSSPPCNDGEGSHNDGVPSPDQHVGLAIVQFTTNNDACAAKDILDGIVVGGHKLQTSLLDSIKLA